MTPELLSRTDVPQKVVKYRCYSAHASPPPAKAPHPNRSRVAVGNRHLLIKVFRVRAQLGGVKTQLVTPAAMIAVTSETGETRTCQPISTLGGQEKMVTLTVDFGEKWFDKLNAVAQLKDGWNGYTAPAPSARAVQAAHSFLQSMIAEFYPPSRVAASAVGGVGVTRRHGGKKAYVEFYNNGSAHVLFAGDNDEITDKVTPNEAGFQNLIAKMKAYLNE